MSRSKWKNNYLSHFLIKKVKENSEAVKTYSNKENSDSLVSIWIWCRNAVIQESFVGSRFLVYNGKRHVPVTINDNMVGHKFGEFSYTRAKYIPKKKK